MRLFEEYVPLDVAFIFLHRLLSFSLVCSFALSGRCDGSSCEHGTAYTWPCASSLLWKSRFVCGIRFLSNGNKGSGHYVKIANVFKYFPFICIYICMYVCMYACILFITAHSKWYKILAFPPARIPIFILLHPFVQWFNEAPRIALASLNQGDRQFYHMTWHFLLLIRVSMSLDGNMEYGICKIWGISSDS